MIQIQMTTDRITNSSSKSRRPHLRLPLNLPSTSKPSWWPDRTLQDSFLQPPRRILSPTPSESRNYFPAATYIVPAAVEWCGASTGDVYPCVHYIGFNVQRRRLGCATHSRFLCVFHRSAPSSGDGLCITIWIIIPLVQYLVIEPSQKSILLLIHFHTEMKFKKFELQIEKSKKNWNDSIWKARLMLPIWPKKKWHNINIIIQRSKFSKMLSFSAI